MSTTLVLTFPLGRYHANPWGRHVNEGAVELPPSPWRLLRGLYAVWRTRAPELPEDVVHRLLGELAKPPMFFVPYYTVAHTRHYYPDSVHRTGDSSTDRTLDAFAVIDRDAELAIRWPVTLPPEEHAALSTLADAMPYFGRADSVCEARVADTWDPGSHDVWSPVDVAESVPGGAEVTSVLAPELPLSLASLEARPVDVRRGDLLFPSGTRFVGYQRNSSALPPAVDTDGDEQPTAVRFDILDRVLPQATEAVAYTDLLRSAALARLGEQRQQRDASTLGGKTHDSREARGNHQHVHYLPLLREGKLTGFAVWGPPGIPEGELRALRRVTRLYTQAQTSWRANVRVSGVGDVHSVARELSDSTTSWHSVMPFSPNRYPKNRYTEQQYFQADVEHELRYRGISAGAEVELLDHDWTEFRRYRPSARMRRDRKQGRPKPRSAFLRLRFDRPVGGPLALGHLSHFGLGLFAPSIER